MFIDPFAELVRIGLNIFSSAFIVIFILQFKKKERELLAEKRKSDEPHKELVPTERKAEEDLWLGDIRYKIVNDKKIIRGMIIPTFTKSIKVTAGIYILGIVATVAVVIISIPMMIIVRVAGYMFH